MQFRFGVIRAEELLHAKVILLEGETLSGFVLVGGDVFLHRGGEQFPMRVAGVSDQKRLIVNDSPAARLVAAETSSLQGTRAKQPERPAFPAVARPSSGSPCWH